MNGSHTTSSSDCAARPINGFPKKSPRLTPQQADEAKKRSERTDKTGRSNKARPHSRLYGWLLSSPEWLAASCADRAALMVLMAHENGSNNGRVRMGARRLAGWRNEGNSPAVIEPDVKGRSAAAERLSSLAEAGLIVRTNTPSKGPTEARREAEWLLPFYGDTRKGAQPTPFTARWKPVATKKPPFYMLTKEVTATPAWKALSDPAQVLFVTLGVEVMKRTKYDRTPPLAISVRQMAELMGVSEDTAHRAIRDLEAKGFVMRHVAGRGLAGQRVTATFSLDTEPCRPEPGIIHGPRRRFASWQPGENLSSTPLRRQPRAKPEPEVVAEAEVEVEAAPIAEPEATIAVQSPPEPPAPTTTEEPGITTTAPAPNAPEENIDMSNITDPRVAAHILKGLHYSTLDRFGKPFPMTEDAAYVAVLVAADAHGKANAVGVFRAAALDAIAKAATLADIVPIVNAALGVIPTTKGKRPRKAA